MKKLLSLFVALICASSLFASAQVDGIWYVFSFLNKTASVTYQGDSPSEYDNEYIGHIVIPKTVTYKSTTYSVTTIGYGAFYGCSGLTSVTIPNSVTTIETNAFRDCSGLTSVTIPNSVTTIETNAFRDCSGLTSVTIPNSVTTIGNWAFFNCSALNSITIPNSVTTIKYEAFYGCSGLTSIEIPNSVTTIEEGAFEGCSGLTSVTIPNSVTTIEYGAFDGCTSLPSPLYNATIFAYLPESYKGAYTIPEGIKQIAGGAFYDCIGLTSVTIPHSVTTIEYGAFMSCSASLTSIYVDAANTHYCSIDGILFNYAQDTLIQYPSGNTRTEYIIPYSVTTIGKRAFYKCYSLTSITLPNSVTTIGYWAFAYCNGLTSVTIPNSVTTIEEGAFLGCSGLTSVTIPNSVTTIGDNAFYYCSDLTSVTIPNSVTTIGHGAFRSCEGLTSITCYAVTPPECSNYVFNNISQDAKVYVPASSLTDYQNAKEWKDMHLYPIAAEVTPMDDENPVVTPSDQDVTITWPITDGTDTYTLTITKNGEVVCVLTFNANGQLTNIAFAAPSHNGARQAPAATLTAQGYQFTVTGLNPGTAYSYNVTATDASRQTLAEYKGNFSTTGGTGLNTLPYEGKDGIGSKYFHNGNLIIERNGIKYTATGQKVR